MFYFKGTRKPNFENISQNIYDDFWNKKTDKFRSKLMDREYIFIDWIKPNSRVLSIGCGNSRLLFDLKNKKNCDVYGVDMAESVVNLLKINNISAKKIDVAFSDFENAEFFAKKFDYIVMSELLEHLVLPEKIARSLADKTDYFVISLPNSAFYRYRIGLMFKGRFFTQWARHPSEHLRYWSHIDFLDWLKALNFNIIEFKSSNGPFLKNIWPNMFGNQICYLVKTGLSS